MEVWFVDQVLEEVYSGIQCVKLIRLPLDIANRKRDLAILINEKIHLLKFKYDGVPTSNSSKWKSFLKEYWEKTEYLFEQYYRLTLLNVGERAEVFRNRNYSMGEILGDIE